MQAQAAPPQLQRRLATIALGVYALKIPSDAKRFLNDEDEGKTTTVQRKQQVQWLLPLL
jgi:hypothetical protein